MLATLKELLRIQLSGLFCRCCAFSQVRHAMSMLSYLLVHLRYLASASLLLHATLCA